MSYNSDDDILGRNLLEAAPPPAYRVVDRASSPSGGPPPRRVSSRRVSVRSSSHSRRQRRPPSPLRNPQPPPPPPVINVQSDGPSISRRGQRLVISLDFGTTYSGLAWATTEAQNGVDLARIKVLQNWSPKMSNMDKVPSIVSYTETHSGEAQWGTDLSKDAVTMVNQKLELEQQSSKVDELDLTLHVLRGTKFLSFEHIVKAGSNPDFSCKLPEEIVENYLTHIFKCARSTQDINMQQLSITKTAVDLVVTVPVSWSYQAYNSMFKAVRKAGFNEVSLPTLKDTILVTEPEAAAYFTARDLKEREIDFLQDQCFVLCDAGGGTVDAVAYQVKKVGPPLELERVTEPRGRKCGSALIDTAFKVWLREIIGIANFAKIDRFNARQQRISPHTAEPPIMRSLIKKFAEKKQSFTNHNRASIKIDLPTELDDLTIAGRVDQGELTLHWREMKTIMDTCVNEAVELVLEQIEQVLQAKSRRVKKVYLVGGFGASPYLQEELTTSFEALGKALRRPDTDKSLTAVVQGGVIYGVEKARHRNVTYMRAATESYGILLHNSNFEWLIRKGDLIFSNKSEVIESSIFWCHPRQNYRNNRYHFAVFCYIGDGGDYEVDLPEDWKTGQHEVSRVGIVPVDPQYFSGRAVVPGDPRYGDHGGMIGPLRWRLVLTDTAIKAELVLKDNEDKVGRLLGSCPIKLDRPADRGRSTDDVEDVEDGY